MNDIFSFLCQCLLISVVQEITCRADDYQRLVNDARENYLNREGNYNNADLQSDAYLDQARRLYEEAYADRRRERYDREAPVARMDGNRLQYPEIGNYLRPHNAIPQGYQAVRSGASHENDALIEEGTNGTSLSSAAKAAGSSFSAQSQFQQESSYSQSQSSIYKGVAKIDDGKQISNKYITNADCACESSKTDRGFLCLYYVNGGSDIKIQYDGFSKVNVRELISAINKWSQEYSVKIDVNSITDNKGINIIDDTNRGIPDINSLLDNIDISSIINGQIQSDNNINIDSIIDINSIIDKNDLITDTNTFVIPDITLSVDHINQINSYIQSYFNADFQAKFNAQFNAMLKIKALLEAQAQALAEVTKAKLIAEAKGRVSAKIIADFEKYTAAFQQAKLQLQAQLKLVAQLMAIVKAKLLASNINVQETFKIPIIGLDFNEFIKLKPKEQSKGIIINGAKKIFGAFDFGIDGAFGINAQGGINGGIYGGGGAQAYGGGGAQVYGGGRAQAYGGGAVQAYGGGGAQAYGGGGAQAYGGGGAQAYGGGGAQAYGGGGAQAYGGGGAQAYGGGGVQVYGGGGAQAYGGGGVAAYGGGGAAAYGGGGAQAYGGAAAYGGLGAGSGASGAIGGADAGVGAAQFASEGYSGGADAGVETGVDLHNRDNIVYDDLMKRQHISDYFFPDTMVQADRLYNKGIRGNQIPGVDATPTSFGPYSPKRFHG